MFCLHLSVQRMHYRQIYECEAHKTLNSFVFDLVPNVKEQVFLYLQLKVACASTTAREEAKEVLRPTKTRYAL